MTSTQLTTRLWLSFLVLALVFTGGLHAQIPGLLNGTGKKPAAASVETPEETETRLQEWLKEARAAFSRVNAPDAEAALPEDITPGAAAEYRRDLEQIITGINRYRKTLENIPEASKALAEARANDEAWQSFAEKPPFSILMLDELLNQQDSIREKDASYRSSLALFTRTLTGIQDEARDAAEASRRAVSAAAEETSVAGAAKWRLEADRTKSRLLAVRATYLRAAVALLKEQSETTKSQLALLERQIAVARKNVRFNDDDLAIVQKAANDRQTALRKELVAIRKREREANSTKNSMQIVKDNLLKATPEGTPLEETPELALATVKMEASETRVDSLQFIADLLETLDEMEADSVESYEQRKALLDAPTKEASDTALQTLRASQDRIAARVVVFNNELAAINADIGRQEARASARPAEDPSLLPLNDVRAALWEKQAIIQRAVQTAAAQNRMLKRWLADYELSEGNRTIGKRVSDDVAAVWIRLKSVWTAEVFTYNDTVMIGGVPSTQERGVTLGQIAIAIAAFLIAYFIARRITNRLGHTVVRRGRIAEAQAKTLGNWLMIVIGMVLAVSTLHFLKIPLTVFAFFGGALAIGLGFGTQTLIKNFISGIIVLFERKIRVGDVVDIGGVSGAVVEINTRSSISSS